MNAPDRKPLDTTPPAPRYDADFFAWTQDQANRLKGLRPKGLDWINLADEIESLGRSEKRDIESRLSVLLVHLLKWRFQPEPRSGSWRASVVEQRTRMARELAASPSLRGYPAEILAEEYELARPRAADETGLPLESFPTRCPFSIDEVLDPEFWPGPGEARPSRA